jgi:hypothetical protein
MSWQAFAFHAGIKSGFYAYGIGAPIRYGIWAYEVGSGNDVPFLVEVGASVGLPIALGTADEALSRQWKRHGHTMTWKLVKSSGRAARATARALAKGSVRVFTRTGMRVLGIAGWAMLTHEFVDRNYPGGAWRFYYDAYSGFADPQHQTDGMRHVPFQEVIDWIPSAG